MNRSVSTLTMLGAVVGLVGILNVLHGNIKLGLLMLAASVITIALDTKEQPPSPPMGP